LPVHDHRLDSRFAVCDDDSVGSATNRRTETSLKCHAEISAPAVLLYELVADLDSMADLSPECAACWWLGDATQAVAGARFRGRCRRGWRRWTTTAEVMEATPGRRISWKVTYWTRPVAQWTYEFVELDNGRTMVTEGCVDQRRPVLRRTSGLITGSKDRAARNDDTMHTTLARLKAAAEASGTSLR
jgi:hypothetical protein